MDDYSEFPRMAEHGGEQPQERAIPSDAERQPVVTIKDGRAICDSRDVAAFFEKRHDNVMRDIRDLVAKESKLALLNFEAFKTKDLTGESTSHYEMDRDGFTLLAMGFTGAKALKWKLRYIEAFNAMEAELRAKPRVMIDFTDPKVLLGCMVRWSSFSGQIGGFAKLGSGLRHAASSMPAGVTWTSAGVCPPKAV